MFQTGTSTRRGDRPTGRGRRPAESPGRSRRWSGRAPAPRRTTCQQRRERGDDPGGRHQDVAGPDDRPVQHQGPALQHQHEPPDLGPGGEQRGTAASTASQGTRRSAAPGIRPAAGPVLPDRAPVRQTTGGNPQRGNPVGRRSVIRGPSSGRTGRGAARRRRRRHRVAECATHRWHGRPLEDAAAESTAIRLPRPGRAWRPEAAAHRRRYRLQHLAAPRQRDVPALEAAGTGRRSVDRRSSRTPGAGAHGGSDHLGAASPSATIGRPAGRPAPMPPATLTVSQPCGFR